MFVYRVTNTINGKKYIGITIKSIAHRWRQHINGAGKANYVFARAIKKHGPKNFSVEEVARASSIEDLYELEKQFIQLEKTHVTLGKGYNTTLGGGGSHGLQHSAVARALVSAAQIKHWSDPEVRARMSAKMIGHKQSAETIAKKSAAHTGKKHTAETKLRLSQIAATRRRGPHSEETRRKMSESGKGKVRTPEHCAALSIVAKNRPRRRHSEETKAKISASNIATKAQNQRPGRPHSIKTKAKMSVSSKAAHARRASLKKEGI